MTEADNTQHVTTVLSRLRSAIKLCMPKAMRNAILRLFRSEKPRVSDTFLIHIGKCGGSSLREAIRSVGDEFPLEIVHVEKPVYDPAFRYIIVARGPVSRAISAFNWRYKLVVEEATQRDRFPGESDVLEKYQSLDALALALYDERGRPNEVAHAEARRIHHLREDIGFYLTDLLTRCRSDQLLAVLMQENLDADIERVFGVKTALREKDNSAAAAVPLSTAAETNLRQFLADDYAALEKLYEWGLIADNVYRGLR